MFRKSKRSLVQTITLNIAITAVIAILLQLGIVATKSYLDEQDLHINYITHQTRLLSTRLRPKPNGVWLKSGRIPAQYTEDPKGNYAFRVLSEKGEALEEHNGELISKVSPWASGKSSAQDFWIVDLKPGQRLHVAGGMRHRLGDKILFIEVATLGDPLNTSFAILAAEFLDDVWLPMIPLIVFTLGVAVISVRRSLRPLTEMAELAATSSSAPHEFKLNTSELPKEVASFVVAINGLLERVRLLINSQQTFIARAAHELRTPLAAMMLEVELVREHGTARLESDIRNMSQLVDRLLILARMEIKDVSVVQPVNLATLADDTIDQFRRLIEISDHHISLTAKEPVDVLGDPNAIREALRNLVENATMHTPSGTRIEVSVGPGSRISVEDNGLGWNTVDTAKLLEPFERGGETRTGSGLGLSIVQQAAETLNADLDLGTSQTGGAKVTIVWADAKSQIHDSAMTTSS